MRLGLFVLPWLAALCKAGFVSLSDDNVLHIGGIFPIAGQGGWQGGQACHPAAQLALDDVNKRPDLLPGYQLQLHWNDSEVGYIRHVLSWIMTDLSSIFLWNRVDSITTQPHQRPDKRSSRLSCRIGPAF